MQHCTYINYIDYHESVKMFHIVCVSIIMNMILINNVDNNIQREFFRKQAMWDKLPINQLLSFTTNTTMYIICE